MNSRILAMGLMALGYLILSAILIAGWILHNHSYDSFVDAILGHLHREDLKTVVSTTYFTIDKFSFIQKLSVASSALSVLLMVMLFLKRKIILVFLQQQMSRCLALLDSIIATIKQSSSRTKLALAIILCLIVARSVTFALAFNIQYDEAWNYNYFIHQPLYYSAFAYNNYPLHNIITQLLLQVLPDSTFTIRLSVILFGCLSCISIFVIIKKIWKEEWLALLAVALFASLPISIYYMLYARGVMVNMFFLIWSFYVLYRSSTKNLSRFEYGLWAVIQALAMFSMLSHAYFILLSAFLLFMHLFLQKKFMALRSFIFFIAVSILFIVVLLFPMMLGTGIHSGIKAGLLSGSWLSLHHLPYHCYAEFYSGFWFGFYPLLLLNIVYLFLSKLNSYRFLTITNLTQLLAVPAIYQFTSVYPPERALSFLLLPVLITLSLGFIVIGRKWSLWIGIPLCLILNYTAYTGDYMNWSKKLDDSVEELASKLMNQQVEVLYNTQANFNYFVPGIMYYYSLHGRLFSYYTNQPASTRYRTIESLGKINAYIEGSASHSQDSCIYLHEGFCVYLKR